MFTGWDRATGTREGTVTDTPGAPVVRREFVHSAEGIAPTLGGPAREGSTPADPPGAIEATRALVADRPSAAGHPVILEYPSAFGEMRPGRAACKTKADTADKPELAGCLRTDGYLWPRLAPVERVTLEPQVRTRQRADHVAVRVAATSEPAVLVEACRLDGQAVLAGLDSDIALASVEPYRSPAPASKVTAGRREARGRHHGYSGRRARDVRGRHLCFTLRATLCPSEALTEQLDRVQVDRVQVERVQVERVQGTRATIRPLAQAIGGVAAMYPYAWPFAAPPSNGKVNLGRIIAELGPALKRSWSGGLAKTGVVPVARQHGGAVTFWQAADGRPRLALVGHAANSQHTGISAAGICKGIRGGKPHTALILARSWPRVTCTCWYMATRCRPDTCCAGNKVNQGSPVTPAAERLTQGLHSASTCRIGNRGPFMPGLLQLIAHGFASSLPPRPPPAVSRAGRAATLFTAGSPNDFACGRRCRSARR
ncbi:hypothetical protein [Streptomyces sp. URMC 129]|uniref:hypothetical protein n=1 Tax=Streptomyces sp. URMC 129 TaxID=3423407 RepID=UPI003F1A5945